ncbi:hypothetical protein M5K25_018514 [Dendrobium thyrsiflorum]|uniref:Dof-type domain-containing protein n=1 Tax=Dendrobium thyrsiflorum TaxID=117978 RepID=A0ABD0UI73_DENTH
MSALNLLPIFEEDALCPNHFQATRQNLWLRIPFSCSRRNPSPHLPCLTESGAGQNQAAVSRKKQGSNEQEERGGEKQGRETEEKRGGMDPVIKLFGKTIQLPAGRQGLANGRDDSNGYEKKFSPMILRASSKKQDNHESKHKNEETRFSQQEERIDEKKKSEANEEKNNIPMDKTLKKPDKILPCPRCKSMDTKFCYFNNYNVNQPRHFCKNCQRYWTEGGSMRNVPVGAGRRKSKSSMTNQCYNHHIRIPDCAQADFYESKNKLSPLKHNGTVLSFNAEAPLCESMDSNLENQFSRSLVTPWPNPWSHTPSYPMTPYLAMPWLCSCRHSTVSGKRSREENMLSYINSGNGDIAKSEKYLWISKKLRISDDHEKAANCSVWAKLGFKNDKTDKIFRSAEASQVLCANPAALYRSLNFQERL